MKNNKAVMNKLAEAWNEFIKEAEINYMDSDNKNRGMIRDEIDDFRKGINELQRLVSTRELRNRDPEFFDGKDERPQFPRDRKDWQIR